MIHLSGYLYDLLWLLHLVLLLRWHWLLLLRLHRLLLLYGIDGTLNELCPIASSILRNEGLCCLLLLKIEQIEISTSYGMMDEECNMKVEA